MESLNFLINLSMVTTNTEPISDEPKPSLKLGTIPTNLKNKFGGLGNDIWSHNTPGIP